MIANRPGGTRAHIYASTTDTFDGDIDFIAVEHALNGDPVKLTTDEKIMAARILDSRRLPVLEIAGRVGSAQETVAAWKVNGWKPGPARSKVAEWTPPTCGEPRMYRQHLRNGEKPCDACRAANAAADRRYRLTGSRSAT